MTEVAAAAAEWAGRQIVIELSVVAGALMTIGSLVGSVVWGIRRGFGQVLRLLDDRMHQLAAERDVNLALAAWEWSQQIEQESKTRDERLERKLEDLRQAVNEDVEARLAPIVAELRPDGGNSTRDRIDQTAEMVSRLERQLSAHMDDSEADRRDLRSQIDRLSR